MKKKRLKVQRYDHLFRFKLQGSKARLRFRDQFILVYLQGSTSCPERFVVATGQGFLGERVQRQVVEYIVVLVVIFQRSFCTMFYYSCYVVILVSGRHGQHFEAIRDEKNVGQCLPLPIGPQDVMHQSVGAVWQIIERGHRRLVLARAVFAHYTTVEQPDQFLLAVSEDGIEVQGLSDLVMPMQSNHKCSLMQGMVGAGERSQSQANNSLQRFPNALQLLLQRFHGHQKVVALAHLGAQVLKAPRSGFCFQEKGYEKHNNMKYLRLKFLHIHIRTVD